MRHSTILKLTVVGLLAAVTATDAQVIPKGKHPLYSPDMPPQAYEDHEY